MIGTQKQMTTSGGVNPRRSGFCWVWKYVQRRMLGAMFSISAAPRFKYTFRVDGREHCDNHLTYNYD